jgi:threonine synthase
VTSPSALAGKPGVIRRYGDHLPVSGSTPIVTLGEGDTPLVHSERLSREIGAQVWLKFEGANPTGSFKDRGMAVAISKALEDGATAVVCASTGNTSASAAAYAARAGIRCAVLVSHGNIAGGKLAQTTAHGARVIEIDAAFDRALELTKEIATSHPVTLVNSINPHRIEGQKTAAFEIVESLGRAPDLHVMPVGNAGNMTAYWRGYEEARRASWSSTLPVMYGIQAKGADPIVRGEPVSEPKTIAGAIRIGNPASWRGAIVAAEDSGGRILSVTDEEIVNAYRSLALEGVFVELASAATVAGLRRLRGNGLVPRDSVVVCVLTGHGLKDADSAGAPSQSPRRVRATLDAVVDAIQL